LPSTRPARAALAKPAPMDAATSATVTGAENSRREPSGRVMWIIVNEMDQGRQKKRGTVRGVITKVPFSLLKPEKGFSLTPVDALGGHKKAGPCYGPGLSLRVPNQWNCSSSVEPVNAVTLDFPPWITVVTSSK
jgi:hypothetical protein